MKPLNQCFGRIWVKEWVDLKYFVGGEGRYREGTELLPFLSRKLLISQTA